MQCRRGSDRADDGLRVRLRREHAAPAAVTWTGLALGVLALVSTLGNLSQDTMFVQYPVFLLFLFWMLAAGLVLGLRGVPERSR